MPDERMQPETAGQSRPVGDAAVNSGADSAPRPGFVADSSSPVGKKIDDGTGAPRLLLEPGIEPVPGYRLAELIGEGGFGQVWKANGPGDFLVAIKFVRLGNKAEVVEMRSLELMKNIRHANLLTVFGAWQDHGYLIIAMELADRTLLDYYQELTGQSLPGIPIPELFDYMLEAAKGIDHLNNMGIQHRDIKPHNLFLVGGSVKVADFGLAKVVEQKAASHTGTGMTPAYAAPEFFAGKTTPQSDQYSLAVTYCHLRNGRLPFEGSAAQIMAGHFFEKPDLTMLPEEERPIVARALGKKPEDRWPTCRIFVQSLIEASTVGHGGGQPPPVRRAVIADRTEPQARPKGGKSKPRPGGDTAPAYTEPMTKPKSKPRPGAKAGPGSKSAPLAKKSTKSKGLWAGLGVALVAGVAAIALIIWQPWQGRSGNVGDGDNSSDLNSSPTLEFARSFRHTPSVLGVAYFPDGKRVVSAGRDGVLRVWDVESGKELYAMRGHTAPVTCVAIAADGRHILSGSEDKTVRLWDAENGKDLRILRGHTDMVMSVAISADGRRGASGSDDKTVRIWDLEKESVAKPMELKHSDWVLAVAISSDGKRVLAGGVNGFLRLWDADKGQSLRDLQGHDGDVLCVAFTGDGKRAVSTGADKKVRIWKTESSDPVKVLTGHDDRISAAAFSQDGQQILSGSEDRTVRLWDVEAGKEIGGARKVFSDRISSVAFAPDRRRALCGVSDGWVRLWGLAK
jgi:serine/threonine protein kinase